MTQAYTPGLKVAPRTVLRARRMLPVPGTVLVSEGKSVSARDVVAQSDIPGDITPLNLAQQLGVSPGDLPRLMHKRVGDVIEVGDILAKTRGLFGLFQAEARSTVPGTIETVSHVTGQVMVRHAALPVRVEAYLAGRVVEVLPHSGVVIEAEVTLVQGIFGVGGEAYGPIHKACGKPSDPLTAEHILPAHAGAILIGGARVTAEAIAKAVKLGVSALVTGGIDDRDLRDFLGYDLGVAVTGHEKLGLTVIVTEGFGDIAMAERSFALLTSREGESASVNGATQIRAGVLRPEVVIPWLKPATSSAQNVAPRRLGLAVGAPVRLIRDPHFGLIGTVADLPNEPRVLESGSKARVLIVKLQSGTSVVVPRANVELIEE